LVRDADELHDVLLSHGVVVEQDDWRSYFDELRSTGRATTVDRGGLQLIWVATERLPLILAIWPNAVPNPNVSIPSGVRRDWPREEGIVHLVRGHMEYLGPTTIAELTRLLGLEGSDVEISLIHLENQGSVLRGKFTGAADLEWCDRRLLARIHRFTLEGLRRQIAPVSPEQYIQFLLRHQHVHSATRLREQLGLLALVEQFEGFEAPAGHWEKHLFAARMDAYNASWLDNVTFHGQVVWGRLRPVVAGGANALTNGRPMKSLTRSTPITLMLRDHLPWLLPPMPDAQQVPVDAALGSNAQAAYEAFTRHGALFPSQIGALLQLVPTQVADVIGELAAAGLITSDGFPALRAMIGGRNSRRSRAAAGLPDPSNGRWTLLRSALLPQVHADERTEHWCRLLLRRYGVMFRDMLANEVAAPPWSELVRTYRRVEARGEIRGGRFVAGVSGEQYALPDVITRLRSAGEDSDEAVTLAATDPLNLSGRIGSTSRVAASPGYSIEISGGHVAAVDEILKITARKPLAIPTS
jgi:ATP-dependent Lhr-like helicase